MRVLSANHYFGLLFPCASDFFVLGNTGTGVSTQLQSPGLVAHENSTFRNLALAVSGPFLT